MDSDTQEPTFIKFVLKLKTKDKHILNLIR